MGSRSSNYTTTNFSGSLEVRELDEVNSSQQSISSSVISLRSSTSASKLVLNKNVTVFEPWYDQDTKNIFLNPKIIFTWIYSFSLVLLSILTLLLVAITVIDVIAQTINAAFSEIKLFIVIIVCVAFILWSFFVYFSRILQSRIALNDIPSKSVYVPFEGDYPHDVYKAIDSKIRECIEIKNKAGPLGDDTIIINHSGLSPPDYIQTRNKKAGILEGTYLPPDSVYEEIIRSIGDKFISGKLVGPEIPRQYTLREIILHLHKLYVHNNEVDTLRLIELYEKFRFGPDLIQESELIEFILKFDNLAQLAFYDFRENLQESRKKRMSTNTLDDFDKFDDGHSKSDFGYYDYDYDYDYDYESQYSHSNGTIDVSELDEEFNGDDDKYNDSFHHQQLDDRYFDDVGESYEKEEEEDIEELSSNQSYNPTRRKSSKSTNSNLYPPRRKSHNSVRTKSSGISLDPKPSNNSSTNSLIRNKLAFKTKTNTSEDSIKIRVKDLDYDEHRSYALNKEINQTNGLNKKSENKQNLPYDDLFKSSSGESNSNSDSNDDFYSFRRRLH